MPYNAFSWLRLQSVKLNLVCNYVCITFRMPLCRLVFAVTRERIRQIEAKALRNLRSSDS